MSYIKAHDNRIDFWVSRRLLSPSPGRETTSLADYIYFTVKKERTGQQNKGQCATIFKRGVACLQYVS